MEHRLRSAFGDSTKLWSTAREPIAQIHPGAPGAPGRHFPRILVVDDDAQMLDLQTRMLRHMGHVQVSTAGGAREALLQLEHDPKSAELIICDLTMPDIDGIEFLQMLNASPFRGSVILLSGTSARVMHSVQKLLGGKQLTILGTLTKPTTRNALGNLIDCWQPVAESPCVAPVLHITAHELYEAIRKREWELHYQPQVSLKSGEILGLEALVRWQHPVHGLVYPDQFITIAEACGAIHELTDWVTRTALEDRASLAAEGLQIQMAINLSMESLREPNFWRRFGALVGTTGTHPRDVVLEVAETGIVTSSLVALENLIRLRLQQFMLSIDDFGTGHSTLAQLRDVPFTELKIDRSFVRGARHNQIIRPMLEGSLGIARRLGMRSVAEGVETQSDWQVLREAEYELAQGYFIGKPMTIAHIWDWLINWKERVPRLLES